MKLRQANSRENGKPIPRCWTTECGYTVALCGVDDHAVYIVSAPRTGTPFLYTKNKADVKKSILKHKESKE